MVTLTIADVIFGVFGIFVGIYTIVVTSKKYVPEDKRFLRFAGASSIFFGIWIIVYPFLVNWFRR